MPNAQPAPIEDPPPGCRLIRAPRGRGPQMNAGARLARGRLLLFLHDDTALPPHADQEILEAFARPGVGAASFRLRFDRDHWLLRIYGFCSRFESVATTFGDQGFVIERQLFDAIGGFPDWPLFEDVELARRARRRARFVKLRSTVTTSATRFEHNGLLRQQLFNASLLLRFLLGASPTTLAARYERRGRR